MKHKKITATDTFLRFCIERMRWRRPSGAKEADSGNAECRCCRGYRSMAKSSNESPYAAYPELVTYTLGQMSGANNSNLPDGDTYEDNVYTRYLRKNVEYPERQCIHGTGRPL